MTLLTGAAADNGFQGIQGRFRRKGLLSFADSREGEAIIFKRVDTGEAVAVELDVSLVPGDPAQGGRLMAILQDRADRRSGRHLRMRGKRASAGCCSNSLMIRA